MEIMYPGLQYDGLKFSLEDIAEQVEIMQEYALSRGVSYRDDETARGILDALEHLVAFHESEYNRSLREARERHALQEATDIYLGCLGAVAINSGYRGYDESDGDTGITREIIKEDIHDSTVRVARLVNEKNLTSPLEQGKQVVANDKKARFLLPRTLSALAGGAAGVTIATALKTGESISYFSITPAQGGILGLVAPAIIYNVRSSLRSVSRHIGGVFKFWSEGSIKRYALPDDMNNNGAGIVDYDQALDHYAERDSETERAIVALNLLDYKMRGKEDIAPMVYGALEEHEVRMLASHGINRENNENAAWYRKLATRATGLDFLG